MTESLTRADRGGNETFAENTTDERGVSVESVRLDIFWGEGWTASDSGRLDVRIMVAGDTSSMYTMLFHGSLSELAARLTSR